MRPCRRQGCTVDLDAVGKTAAAVYCSRRCQLKDRPNAEHQAGITVHVRLDRELHARIHEIAQRLELSDRWVIQKLLSDALDHVVPLEEVSLTAWDEEGHES